MENLYINQLESTLQTQVKQLVTNALLELDFTGLELKEMINEALESRLSDLSDLINIDKIIH